MRASYRSSACACREPHLLIVRVTVRFTDVYKLSVPPASPSCPILPGARLKPINLFLCLALGAQFAAAQYKAIVSPPTPWTKTQTGTGDVKAGVDLRAGSGGYAWGQYLGRAVKVSLADGSISYLENVVPTIPTDFSAALASDGANIAGYTGGTTLSCVRWDANGVPTTFTSQGWQESVCGAASGGLVG